MLFSVLFVNDKIVESAINVNPLPADKFSQIGDIKDYNGFIDGEHSADSADTEGPIIITGDSLFPNDTVTFTFGASFRPVNTTVGVPLLDSQVVNVLTNGEIKNYSNAYISFEKGTGGRGWVIGDEDMTNWLTQTMAQEMSLRYFITNPNMDDTLKHFRSERDILASYVAKAVSKTSQTDNWTLPAWGSNGQLPSLPIEDSDIDSHMLVVDLDQATQYHRGDDGLNINGIGIPTSLIKDERYDTIILKSMREKIVFSGGTFSSSGEISLTDPLAAEFAQKISYYLPNATQITNYSDNRQTGNPPQLAAKIDGKDKGVANDGEDLYKTINNLTYGAATIGSVLAPKATVVYSGGNLNGLVMVKDLHQRDWAELHNFRANWVDRDFDLETKGSLKLIKKSIGKDEDLALLPGAKFIMYKETEGVKEYYGFDGTIDYQWYQEREKAYEFVTDTAGEIFISGLPEGKYYMEEVAPPTGHQPLNEVIEFDVTKDVVAEEAVVEKEVINQRTPLITITGEKIWQDDGNSQNLRPEFVTIELYLNDQKIAEQVVSAATNWKYVFKDLKQFDKDNHFNNYTIKEVIVPNYESVISRDQQKVINTLKGDLEFNGEKIWEDDDDQKAGRPKSVTVELFQNNVRQPVATQVVDASTNWRYSFKNFPQYDYLGKLIRYRVVEKLVPGYESIFDPGTGNITNKVIPTIELVGKKTWQDDDDQEGLRPETITIELYQNGKFLKDTVTSAAESWQYEFKNLLTFDSTGQAYQYTIKEVSMPDYESEINPETNQIVNTLVGKTEVKGQKTWLGDGGEEGGYRPESIIVHLLRNGTIIKAIEVTADNDWRFEFLDLPKYDEKGKLYLYTIKEVAVPNYQTKYDEDGFDIVNELKPLIEITGEKIWRDNENSESLRPTTITIELYRNDILQKELEVTKETDWQYEFKNLEKFDDAGELYIYKVVEKKVTNYFSEVLADNQSIINTLVGETEITGEKIWDDNENSAGLRPKAITVQLFQNDELFAETEAKESNDWEYAFTELPKYDQDGKLFVYRINEVSVPGYVTVYNDFDITNTLIPETSTTESSSSESEPSETTTTTSSSESEPSETTTTSSSESEPTETTTSETKPTIGSSSSSSTVTSISNGSKLPQTGGSNSSFFSIIAGGMLLILGQGYYIFSKKD